VPRRSFRNFLQLFGAFRVDDSEKQPDVSQDVQLVYIADDIRQAGYFYGGTGQSEAAVVGEHGILSLACRTTRGLLVDGISMAPPLVFSNPEMILCWSSAVQPTITGPDLLVTPLRGGIAGDDRLLGPQGQATSGTILTGDIAVDTLRVESGNVPWHPFHIPNNFFFNMVWNTANEAVDMGIRWRELRVY